jgi:integrase
MADTKNMLAYNMQAVKAAKTKGGKQTEYHIEGVKGLTLTVYTSGDAAFYVRYNFRETPGGPRQYRRELIGSRDLIDLAYAKVKALELMTGVAKNEDPVGKDAALRAGITLRDLFDARLKKGKPLAANTHSQYRKIMDADILPKLGDMPAAAITADQFVAVLSDIEDRSKHIAHAARSALGSTYRWALQRRVVKVNPVAGLGFIVTPKPRKRLLSNAELRKMWTGLETPGSNISPNMARMMKLCLLTGQRRAEVMGARIDELTDLDGPAPIWKLPADRMKRKKHDQYVPLSVQAAALFRAAIASRPDAIMVQGGDAYVFPADLTRVRIGKKPKTPSMSPESASKAMRRLRDEVGITDATLHDMRKVITTWLSETGTQGPILDRILHHAGNGVTATTYDHSMQVDPLRIAYQRWSDNVWAVTGQAVAGENVVSLRPAARVA